MILNIENTANNRLLGYRKISKLLNVMDSFTNKRIDEAKKDILKVKDGNR